MFSKEFYPTPDAVIAEMLEGSDVHGRTILEPSAGKGNIIDYVKKLGAKEVLSCELNDELSLIVASKSRFLSNDFFDVSSEQISHVSMIIMNPPFSEDVKHFLHAFEIAPPGCEIICLCNYSSLDNDYSRERKQMLRIIDDYGSAPGKNLGKVFDDAERKTGVEVGLIKVFKPGVNEETLSGFFMDEDDQGDGKEGVMPYNKIRDIVQRYVNAIKCFDKHEAIAEEMNSYTSIFNVGT